MGWRILRWLWREPEPPASLFLQAGNDRTEFGTRRIRTSLGPNMALSPKDPDSEEVFNRDCSRLLQSGAGGTIASIVSAAFEEGDDACVVLAAPAISSSGLVWSVKLGGGTDGVTYRYRVRILTTAGETLDTSISFFVYDAAA